MTPITKAQIEGKEPLRTFGALKQLFASLNDPAAGEGPMEATPEVKPKRPPPVVTEIPAVDVAQGIESEASLPSSLPAESGGESGSPESNPEAES